MTNYTQLVRIRSVMRHLVEYGLTGWPRREEIWIQNVAHIIL